jgi:hypothetical protein
VRFLANKVTLEASVLPGQCPCTHLHPHVATTRRTNGRSLGTFQKAMLLRKSESFAWKCKVENVLAAEGKLRGEHCKFLQEAD